MSERFNHPDGAWVSPGPSGDLRARMSARDAGDAKPGFGDMHRNAAKVLADRDDVTVNGVRYRRDALGGVSISTGPDLRAALSASSAALQVAADVTPSARPEEPRVTIGDPIAALTAHLPAGARGPSVKKTANTDDATDALARAMFSRVTGGAS